MQIDWEKLGDEQAIRDVLARYWRGIDRQDPELVLGTYHPGAYDDHGYYKGPVEGFVETLRPGVWAYFSNTQHFAGNLQIDFLGPDRARVESYAEAHHIQRASGGPGSAATLGADGADRDLVYGLRYVDLFERRDDEWRIGRRVCAWDWHRVDLLGGVELNKACLRGQHSKQDPVYRFPAPHGRRVGRDELVAKQACYDALMRYSRGIDRCDPDVVRSAYHADAHHDHGVYRGSVSGFVDRLEATLAVQFTCTMHKLGNVLVTVDGNRAFAETYATTHHIAPRNAGSGPSAAGDGATDTVFAVRYLDRLEERGDGWKIADRQLSFEWERRVEVGSQQEYPGFLRGQRDGSDPVLESLPRPASPPSIGLGRSQVSVPAGYSLVADRAAIYRQLVRYCRGVDRRDLDLIRSTYHPDAFDDHGSYKGDVEGFLAFVEKEVHARFRITMHKLGQSLIEIDGDEARSESYATCHHVMAEGVSAETVMAAADPTAAAPGAPGSAAGVPMAARDVADMVMGIRYLDRFERRMGEWRIARRELRWEWVRTDRLEGLDASWTHGRVDSGDAVFAG